MKEMKFNYEQPLCEIIEMELAENVMLDPSPGGAGGGNSYNNYPDDF